MKQIFLFIAVLLSIPGISQKIDNTLVFEKGRKLEMVITINSSIASMGTSTVDAVIERVFDIEDVVNGNTMIEHKVRRIQFKMQSMMGNQDFDSEREQDRKGNLGKALEKTLKNKYSMTVDPTGKILSVKKDDDNNAENKAASGDMLGNILAQLGEGLKEPEAGERSDFLILPAKEVSIGESWMDSVENKTSRYTIGEITDSTIVIQLTEEAKIEQKQEMMGSEITITTNDKSTGKIILDRKTKLLKEKILVTNSEGTMSAMGQTVQINSTTTKKWVVR